MKLVSEAARCGNLEEAKSIIAAASGSTSESAPIAAVARSPVVEPAAAVSAVAMPTAMPSMAPALAPARTPADQLEPAEAVPVSSSERVLEEKETLDKDASPSEPEDEKSPYASEAAAGHESLPDDWIFTSPYYEPLDIVSVSAKKTDLRSTANATAPNGKVRLTDDGWEIKCNVDTERPCQSMRTKLRGGKPDDQIMSAVGTDNTAAFAAACFENMLQREQELEGKFCVFYHSYNGAALLYEVQTEIARAAFDLPDNQAPLPRIQSGAFEGISLGDLRNSYGAGQDHDPTFRALAISASPTLFSYGSEAPPLHCFRHGYGCTDLSFRGLLVKVLRDSCEVSEHYAGSLADQLAAVAHRFGIQGHNFGNRTATAPKRLGGHMLQIFIACSEVDKLVYHSLPFGLPIDSTKSVRNWLAGNENAVDGQVRILFNPEVFIDPNRARLYHYCGDWEFLGGSPDMEGSRAAFVLELRKILQPVLKNAAQVRRKLRTATRTTLTAKVHTAPTPAPAPASVTETPKEHTSWHKKSSGGKKKSKKHG